MKMTRNENSKRMVTELLYDKSFENVYTSMYLGTMQININEVHDENMRIIKLTKFFFIQSTITYYGRKHVIFCTFQSIC